MKNLFTAMVVAFASVGLALLIGLAGSLRLFGPMVIGVLTIFAAPFVYLFSLWLHRARYEEFSLFFGRVAKIMIVLALVQFGFPQVWPGIVSWMGAKRDTLNRTAQNEADLEGTPQVVPCTPPYTIGKEGHPRYWWSTQDDPVVCYDRPGINPHASRGDQLLPVQGTAIEVIETQARVRKAMQELAQMQKREQLELALPPPMIPRRVSVPE